MRKYSVEFKRQAVELAESLGNVVLAAKQLGVSDANIYNWKSKFQSLAEPRQDKSSLSADEYEELKRLRRENNDLKKVNQILKSAAAFFSQDHLK